MTRTGTTAHLTTAAPGRIDWVDYAKGICIILVVMMHSVLGVENAAGQTGFMHYVVEFARPFRMPDFFLISGLFLAVVIDRDWRTYLDRKVVHFAYFYVLWLTIQFAFKSPSYAADAGWAHVAYMYALSFIDPFGTLWSIYLLPSAAALEMAHIFTEWTVIDEFAARFVYFYSGYLFASKIFALSERAAEHPKLALTGLALWAVINAALVATGLATWPVISLVLGFAGAGAIIVTATLLAKMRWLDGLRFCGEHSIVIYLAFFLPMVVTRIVLLRYAAPYLDIGTIALMVNIAGVLGALLIWRIAIKTGATFLFERPGAFWIAPRKARPKLQPAA